MSRTFRKKHYNSCALRHPKTSNEIRQLKTLIDDLKDCDYSISGMNHLHHRLSKVPTAWDDQVVSAYYEMDYKD